MKKLKLIILVIVLISSLFMLSGCTNCNADNSRFIKILDEGSYEIICDTKTKVMYLQAIRGMGYQEYGGLTVLLDAEGKTLLYEGD